MAGGAAAITGRRQSIAREQSMRRARQTIRRKQEKRQQLASDVFDKMANSQGRLDDDNVEVFLETSLLISKDKLHPDAVRLVKDTAMTGRKNSCSFNAEDTNISFSKQAMMLAFKKYGLYLQKQGEIDSIFKQFDIDKDGYLSRHELQKALQEREHTADRAVHGIHTELIVSEEDLDFILIQADSSSDGKIDKAEVLTALAAWEELAEGYLEELEKQGVCSCVVL
jgi:hypothetical protein